MQGWSPSIINADGFDIIAVRQGETLRVQSKATKQPYKPTQYQWSCSASRPKRPLTLADCDVVAFVGLDIRRVYFAPVSRVCEQVTFKLPIATMHERDLESATLKAAYAVTNGNR